MENPAVTSAKGIIVSCLTSPASYIPESLDCEQSLFFFRFSNRFSKGSARARDARNEGSSPRRKKERDSCFSHLAPSVTRVAICVSRVLLDGLQKKESLFVVYWKSKQPIYLSKKASKLTTCLLGSTGVVYYLYFSIFWFSGSHFLHFSLP